MSHFFRVTWNVLFSVKCERTFIFRDTWSSHSPLPCTNSTITEIKTTHITRQVSTLFTQNLHRSVLSLSSPYMENTTLTCNWQWLFLKIIWNKNPLQIFPYLLPKPVLRSCTLHILWNETFTTKTFNNLDKTQNQAFYFIQHNWFTRSEVDCPVPYFSVRS